jgi:hypothetical protein
MKPCPLLYRRMDRYLKTQTIYPKLSKFSNVKVPAITAWRMIDGKAANL